MLRSLTQTITAGVLALAGITASAASSNIAFVDMRTVIEGSKHFAQMQQDMQNKLGDKHKELILAQKNIDSERDSLGKQKAVMASSTYNKRTAELKTKQTKLDEKQRQFQEEVMKLQEQSMKSLFTAVKDASKEVATKKGYSIVLQGEPLYIASGGDITEQVKVLVEKKKLK